MIHVRSASVSGRATTAGRPMSSTPEGYVLLGGTRLPAPTIVHGSMTALSITMAPIPTRQSSPMVQPCKMTVWPTVTREPTVRIERPPVVWPTVPSWIDVSSPMVMLPTSPRSETLGHTVLRAPIRTSPMSTARSWTYASGWTSGHTPPKDCRMRGLIAEVPAVSIGRAT